MVTRGCEQNQPAWVELQQLKLTQLLRTLAGFGQVDRSADFGVSSPLTSAADHHLKRRKPQLDGRTDGQSDRRTVGQTGLTLLYTTSSMSGTASRSPSIPKRLLAAPVNSNARDVRRGAVGAAAEPLRARRARRSPMAFTARVPAAWPISKEWMKTSVLLSPLASDSCSRSDQSGLSRSGLCEGVRRAPPQPGRAAAALGRRRGGSNTAPGRPGWAGAARTNHRMTPTPSSRFAGEKSQRFTTSRRR